MTNDTLSLQPAPQKTIPTHRVWLCRPIKNIVLDVGEAFHQKGDVLEIKGLPARIFVFRRPDHIGMILKHPDVGNRKYVRMLPRVKWVMGRGGYILEGGREWRDRRRIVQAAFRRTCLHGYTARISHLVSEMLADWSHSVSSGRPFDVCQGLQRLVTRANFEMFFSHELEEGELSQVIQDTHFIQLNFVRVTPLAVPLAGNLRFKRSVERLRRKMASLLAERRNRQEQPEDLISVLLEAEREHGWSEAELVGEIFSVYFGAAVVATTLAWILHLLASHPESQQRLIDELLRELDGRAATVSDLERLTYAHAVMQESTRLYPPSWGYPRHSEAGMEIDGYQIPPDSMVIPMVYFAHRHPDIWDSPEAFRPERFLGESAGAIPSYSHLPFGAGPRTCLGAQLAPMIIVLTLAGIFQKYRLDSQPRFAGDPIADFGFEIHPQDQIQVTGRPLG